MKQWSGSAPAQTQLLELTSLRFFASLLVVVFHLAKSEYYGEVFNSATLIEHGALGVDLFFVLSGFVMYFVYSRSLQTGGFSYSTYLVKRFARLYPVHFFMTTATVVLYVGASASGLVPNARMMVWEDLPLHYLMLHAWGTTGQLAWNMPSWSISAEFFAYLLFPALFYVSRAVSAAQMAIGSGVLFLSLAAAWQMWFGSALTTTETFGIARILFEFAMGMAACRIFLERPLPARWAGPATALCGAAILTGVFFLPSPIIVIAFPALVYGLASMAQSGTLSPMTYPLIVYLGSISYSTYMIHVPLMTVVSGLSRLLLDNEPTALAVSMLFYFIALYLASAVLYRLIEVPARRYLVQRVSAPPQRNRPRV